MKAYALLILGIASALRSPLVGAPPLPVGPEIAVNTAVQGNHSRARPAFFSDGGFVVVWNDAGTRTTVHARLFAADGSPESGEFRLLAPSSNYQGVTAVVVDSNDSFLVAWNETPLHQPTRVLVQRFRRNGKAAGSAVQVNAKSPRQRFDGLLALIPGGGFVVGWTGEEDQRSPIDNSFTYAYDGFARVFTAGGSALGPEFLIASGFDDQIPRGLAVGPDKTLLVLYNQWEELYALRIGHLGLPGLSTAPFSEDLHVSSDNPDAPGNISALSQALDGSVTVAWTAFGQGDDVYARRFAADASPISRDVKVNTFTGGRQTVGDVATLPNGGFVVVWTDGTGRDGSGAGIFARAFGADNRPLLDHDLRVNQTTVGNQYFPLIAGTADTAANASANGRFVVSWTQSDKGRPTKVRVRFLDN
jgi:hypothetical protein